MYYKYNTCSHKGELGGTRKNSEAAVNSSQLAEKNEEKTKEELNLEAKLLTRLSQHSLFQILDGFRCVDYVAATEDPGAAKWTTEAAERDPLFLKMLGVS